MRRSALVLVTLVAMTAFSGCDNPVVSQSPVAPTPASTPTTTPVTPGILAFSSFVAIANQFGVHAEYALSETTGESGVILESLTFEESGGLNDFLDAWCWGDAPLRIGPRGSLDGKTLGYCQPSIVTKSPGDFAALTAVYKQADGRSDTVRALVRVVRQ
jgi:hypothetical protein